MAAKTDLSEAQVRLALAYYEEFPEEIDEAIREAQVPLRQLQRRFGSAKGIIVIGEDFDEPLEDFEEYS
jgi:hypothetical protein